MYNIKQIKQYLKENLSEKRYNHSIMVADFAKKLATIYKIDQDETYIAALTHDIAKELSIEENKYYIEKYNLPKYLLEEKYTKIIHADIGACVAKELYNANENIYSAIKYHTIGNINMNTLAKIVFISDKVARENLNQELEEIKQLSLTNLDKSILKYLLYQKDKLSIKEKELHQDTKELLNSLLSKVGNKN